MTITVVIPGNPANLNSIKIVRPKGQSIGLINEELSPVGFPPPDHSGFGFFGHKNKSK
jgi:hypothetical protein